MQAPHVGRALRALRLRSGYRQTDVAGRAGITQSTLSLIERGRIDRIPVGTVARVAASLEAELVVFVRWHGGELDRLLDERHSSLAEVVSRLLEASGCDVRAEVSYSEFGERGSIDLLAWHEPTRTLLVIEVKTEITSIEETLRRHDQKVRLGAVVAGKRFGWHPTSVARLLVLPDESTPRRRVRRHAGLFDRTYPLRGRPLRAWVRNPNVRRRACSSCHPAARAMLDTARPSGSGFTVHDQTERTPRTPANSDVGDT
jgi:transcriptional regulator with XRE-family HTH domain